MKYQFQPRFLPFVLLLIPFLTGCPVSLNRVPGSTQQQRDPQTGCDYYLFVPSWHNNEHRWPIVVTCHGTNPYDTAWHQIHEWRGLAEEYGLLVIAPVLKGTDSGRTLDAADQIRRQREDEEAILSMVQRTISSLNGDPDRIYMVGWSGGGYAVYHTGLRNPHIFRALAVRMGSFDEKFVSDVSSRLDPYQPVVIFMASSDFPTINSQCRAAYKWLEGQSMKRVLIREIVGAHERRPKVAFSYFKDITQQFAFVRLSAIKGIDGDPLKVHFYATVDPKPIALVWDFGDQKISNEFTVRHKYAKPGVYDVKVTIITPNNARTERKLRLDLTDNK